MDRGWNSLRNQAAAMASFPKLMVPDYESLAKRADGSQDAFEEKHGGNAPMDANEDRVRDLVRHTMFEKGQSKCIWGELYKVIDYSDVIQGSPRYKMLSSGEAFKRALQTQAHDFIVKHGNHDLFLEICDLTPPWATKRWLRILSREYPTLAFHASINKSYGKRELQSEEAAASYSPAEICLKKLRGIPGHLKGRSAPKKQILASENLRMELESERKRSNDLEEEIWLLKERAFLVSRATFPD